jgi:hypothetical protein
MSMSGQQLRRFRKALARAIKDIPQEEDCYDKKLLFPGPNNIRLHILTPLAKEVMQNIAGQQGLDNEDFVTEEILSDDTRRYTNDTKGRILEQYIIDVVDRQKRWIAVGLQNNNKKSPLQMHVTVNLTMTFPTVNGAPANADWSKSTLFVPRAPNYWAVDLLVWDAGAKILYAIQVTIREQLGGHMGDTLVEKNMTIAKKNGGKDVVVTSTWAIVRDNWATVLPEASKIQLVWLSDNKKATDNYKDEYVVLTESLHND